MTIQNEKVDLSTLRINRDRPEEPKPGKMKYLIGVIVVAAIVGVLWVWKPGFNPTREVSATTVMLTYASQANAVLNAAGYIVPQRKASVASKGTGRLVFLGVEEGDHVKSGQIIARLESNDVEASVNQAAATVAAYKAQVAQAEASVEQTKKEFERSESLYKGAVITASEFEIKNLQYQSAMAALNAAKATLVASEAGLDAARVQQENTVIRAPFDGTVLTKQADVGEIVAPFAAGNSRGAVVTMADMGSLQMEADVSESNIDRVRTDQPCEIVLDAFPEHRYRGVVAKIVPTADRAKATILTKIKFLDIDKKVLPDMSAKVTFLTEALPDSMMQAKPKVTIPLTAMADRGGKRIVFLIRDDVVRVVTPQTGPVNGDRVEVLGGLTVGDRLVNKPDPELKDGDKIKIKG